MRRTVTPEVGDDKVEDGGYIMKQDFIVEGLVALPTFVAVAETKGFSAAARRLGVSPSAVSQTIVKLEASVGTPLLVRTTRKVNLTDAGRALLSEVQPALRQAKAALDQARSGSREVRGRLRLTVPRLACSALAEILARYRESCPEVDVEVEVDDRNVDIVEQGFDAGIRLIESVDRDMVTVRISEPVRFLVYGSKRYLAEQGRPTHPSELVRHRCLGWRSPTTGELYAWEFVVAGKEIEVVVEGPLVTNDAALAIAAAEQGLGLCYIAEGEVPTSSRLEVVLASFCPTVPGLFLYYPASARRDPKLRRFVECARERRRARSR
jgi:DNA-binding transcriptional LysR family regulator